MAAAEADCDAVTGCDAKAELERLSYARYLEEEQAQASTDGLREIVERLLQKLPVNERSVMVLHYYKGLTCEEVSAFLDVSLNTVKSRLYPRSETLRDGGIDASRNLRHKYIKKRTTPR